MWSQVLFVDHIFQVILMALAEQWEMLTRGIIGSRNGLGWKRP